jgi:hypothetical protein
MTISSAARKACFALCAAAVFLSAVCVRHFFRGYAAAKQDFSAARKKSAALNSLLSVKDAVPSFFAGGGVRSYAASAAGEIESLAAGCGVKLVSLRAGVSPAGPGKVVLETEITGNENGLMSFVSALETSLYVFTIHKARIDVLPLGEGLLRARFAVSSALDLPLNAGSDPSNAVELFSRPVPAADKRAKIGGGRLFGKPLETGTEPFPSAGGAEEPGSGTLKLTGVILGAGPAAFLQDTSSGREIRLYPGQQINGFRLERVMKGGVILAKGDKLYEISF